MSRGTTLYTGAGGFAPATFLSSQGIPYPEGYNVADFLLDVASDPPASLARSGAGTPTSSNQNSTGKESSADAEAEGIELATMEKGEARAAVPAPGPEMAKPKQGVKEWFKGGYKTTFLTQLEVLSGREWKVLRRDYSLFLAHFAISCVLGVFVGGLYYHTDITIAGFQSRVGCLFFLVSSRDSRFCGVGMGADERLCRVLWSRSLRSARCITSLRRVRCSCVNARRRTTGESYR